MKTAKVKRCVFCKAEITGMGHNPWPYGTKNDECCDKCNTKIVIPARIAAAFAKKHLQET